MAGSPCPGQPCTEPASRITDDDAQSTLVCNDPARPLELALTTSAPAICAGECVELSARVSHGAAPYAYDWDHGLPGLGPQRVCPGRTTSYTLRVTDSARESRVASVTVAVRSDCAGEPAAPVPVVDCGAELTSSMAVSASVVPMSNGDVYLLGGFVESLSFGAEGLRNFTYNPEPGGFVAKYSGCSYAWSRNLGQGGADVTPVGIARDSRGELVITGNHSGSFDPLRDVPLPGGERSGAFIGRLTPDGEVVGEALLPLGLWASMLDADDNVLLVASAVNGVDLGAGPLALGEDHAPVLVKLDRDFRIVFTRTLGGALSASAALGADGTIHVVGRAQEALRVQGAPAVVQGSPFDFVVRLSAAGSFVNQVVLSPRPTHEQDPYRFEDTTIVGVDASGAAFVTRSCSGGPSLPPARQDLRILRDGSLAYAALRPSFSTVFYAQLMGFDVAASGMYSVFMSRSYSDAEQTRTLREELVREEYGADGQLAATHILLPDVGPSPPALYSARVAPRGELLVSWGDQYRQRFRLIPQP